MGILLCAPLPSPSTLTHYFTLRHKHSVDKLTFSQVSWPIFIFTLWNVYILSLKLDWSSNSQTVNFNMEISDTVSCSINIIHCMLSGILGSIHTKSVKRKGNKTWLSIEFMMSQLHCSCSAGSRRQTTQINCHWSGHCSKRTRFTWLILLIQDL